jgi:membrane dipeptidase
MTASLRAVPGVLSAKRAAILVAAKVCLSVTTLHAADRSSDAALEHARAVLKSTILVDGHNDLPWAVLTYDQAPADVAAYDLRTRAAGDTDLKRLREGLVGAQFWSVYTPGEAKEGFARAQLEQIDIAKRIIARYPEALQFARTAAEVRSAHRTGRIASLLGIEGGHSLENSLGALRAYYELGVRYMTLTHNTNTDWADSSAAPPRHGGLTAFGEAVVGEMNRLGMLVDLSHVSTDTMDDALRVSRAPVIFSHSSARALCDVPRNVPDSILQRVRENGGVVMVTFVPGFISSEVARVEQAADAEFERTTRSTENATEREKLRDVAMRKLVLPPTSIAQVADHIEHIRDVAGMEQIGIGADFDGNEHWPSDLSDVSMYPNLFAELIRRGWSDRDLKLLAGENVLRVLERAEQVAASLQRTTSASTLIFSH